MLSFHLTAAAVADPALRTCWAVVGVCTVVFCARSVAALLPRPWRRRHTGLAALALIPLLAVGGPAAAARYAADRAPYVLPPSPVAGAPLSNDAAAGRVVFSFDDGPGAYTGQMIAELKHLGLHGVFFDIGWKAARYPKLVRAEVTAGEVIGNHTFDHRSFTGKGTGPGTGGPPLTLAQVTSELSEATAAIVAAGAPRPWLWRPPYGAVSLADQAQARALGLRVVMDSGDNIVESNDWAGLTPGQIAARVEPRLRDGTIIAFHDGLPTARNTLRALPLIVAYMNARHLGATTVVRPDATGGVVPNRGGTE